MAGNTGDDGDDLLNFGEDEWDNEKILQVDQHRLEEAQKESEEDPVKNKSTMGDKRYVANIVSQKVWFSLMERILLENMSLKKEVSVQERKFSEQGKRMTEIARRFKQMKKASESQKTENGELKSKICSLNNDLVSKSDEIEKLQTEMATLKQENLKIPAMQQQLEAKSKEIEILTFTSSGLSSENVKLKEECAKVSKLQQELSEKDEIISQLQAEKVSLSSVMREQSDVSEQLKKELKTKSEELSHLTSAPKDFNAATSCLAAVCIRNVDFVCIEASPNEFRWITQETAIKWQQVRNSTLSVAEIKAMFPPMLEAELKKKYSSDTASLTSEIASLKEALEVAKNDFLQYQTKAQILVKKAKQDAKSEFKSESSKKDEEVIRIREELADMHRQLESKIASNEELAALNSSLHSKLTQISEQIKSQDSLQEQMEAEKQSMKRSLEKQIREEQGKLSDEAFKLKSEIQKLQLDLRLAEEMKEGLERRYSMLQKNKESADSNQDLLLEKLKTAERECERLMTENNHLKFRVESLENQAENINIATCTDKETSSIISLSERKSLNRFSSNGNLSNLEANQTLTSFPVLFDALKSEHEKEKQRWQEERMILHDKTNSLHQKLVESQENSQFFKAQLEELNLSRSRELEIGGKEKTLLYLKNIVLKFVLAKDDKERQPLVPVLATMLKFSESETEASLTSLKNKTTPSTFGWLGFT